MLVPRYVPPVRDHLTIRDVRPEDADRIAEVTLAAYRSLPVPMSAQYEAVLIDVPARLQAGATVLVAERSGTILGSVSLTIGENPYFEHRHPTDGDCGLRMLAVDPQATGGGVGRALVETCLELAAAAGCHRMAITSMTWMRAAHRLYLDVGFRRAPELDRTYRTGVGLGFVRPLADADRRAC
jgi:GNAT superfamily N-acetyltransferase